MRRLLPVLVAVALAAGCAGSPGPDESPDPTASPTPSPRPTSIAWIGPDVLDDASTVPLLATAVAGPGGFVAQRVSHGLWEEGPTTALYFSTDGESWEQTFESPGLEVELAAGDNGYVAVGARYRPPAGGDLSLAPWAAWSADGRTWETAAVTLPADDATEAALGTGGGPVIVPATVDPPVVGGTWLSDVVATADGFVALGHTQQAGRLNILWTSADGQAWSPLPEDPFGEEVGVRGLTAGAGYVAHGHLETDGDYPGALVAWHSDDAVTWELAAAGDGFEDEFGAGPFVGGVVALGDGFVMVGTEPTGPPLAWASADGSAWGEPVRLPSLSDTSAQVFAVAASPHFVVAVGREVVAGDDLAPADQYPGIWVSTDGASWTQESPEGLRGDPTEDGISVDSVAWTGEHWVALGSVWDYPDEIPTAVAWSGDES